MVANATLPGVIARRAREMPDAQFLSDATGDSVTYSEAWRRARRAAADFHAAGVAEGEPVAVLLETSVDAIITWVALSLIGAIEVPLNLAYEGELLNRLLQDSGACTVVTGPSNLEALESLPEMVDRIVLLDPSGSSDLAPLGDAVDTHSWSGAGRTGGDVVREDLITRIGGWISACVLYTSGTTGRSKGVVIPWTQLHETAMGLLADLPGPDDVAYIPAPLFHVGGKAPVYLVALTGGSGVLRPSFKTDRFWSEIIDHNCTVTFLGAAMAAFLLEHAQQAPAKGSHPLRDVLMAPTIPRLDDFVERFGVRVCSAYNMTELSCPIVTGWISSTDGSCGQVRDGYECRIVDDKDQPLPEGEVGELVVRTQQPWALSSGYWRRPQATVEAWRNLWFHTGDALKFENGRYYFVDRLTDSIRRRGENISSMELEELLEQDPAVVEAAAVGVPSEYGEEDVLAFVRLAADAVGDPAQLQDRWACYVPTFMSPRFIEIVDDFPRTPNEKVKKSALRSRGIGPDTWERPRSR